jgi:transglutaminase-like putative cysteine protease
MRIRYGFDIAFSIPEPVSVVLMLYTHPSRANTLLKPERLQTEPSLPIEEFIDSFGNRCGRVLAPAGRLRLFTDGMVSDTGLPDAVHPGAVQHPVHELPPETLQYLLGSRYCEVDLLSDLAWGLFSEVPTGWGRVQAICDWAHSQVEFGYEHASATRTAVQVAEERRGVCRDFQHLAITLCRCLHIPARYVTGYLGDIGVPPVPLPMDFSAWFQVYLGGKWYDFDARHNEPRIGRILMACGRDAADVALTTSFGRAPLEHFEVWTDEVPEDVRAAGIDAGTDEEDEPLTAAVAAAGS